MHEKSPNAICCQSRSRSACSTVQSNLGILCSLTYTTVSSNSVSGQRRLIMACVVHKLHKGCFRVLNIIWYFFLMMQHIFYLQINKLFHLYELHVGLSRMLDWTTTVLANLSFLLQHTAARVVSLEMEDICLNSSFF